MRVLAAMGASILVASAVVGQDYSGSWCGTTSQGKAIYFRVTNNQVTYARISYTTNGTGSSCPVGSSKSMSPPVSIAGGRATFGEVTAPPGTVPVIWRIDATFTSPTEASGTFSAAVQPNPVAVCGGVNPGASGTWTATRAAAPLSISPTSQTIGSGGGLARINVAAAGPCSWTAAEFTSWITLQGSSGTGEGTVRYLVQANATGASRSTTIDVNELTASLTQSATPEVRQLPVVGSTAGSLGSFFKTSVQIHNRTTASMTGRFVFHPAGQPGSDSDPALTYSLGASQTRHYADLLPAMNLGGLGSVDVVSTAGGFPVTVARIFNDAGAAGTTGMTEELIGGQQPLGQGDDGVLIAPQDPAASRFNIGVRSLAAGATLVVTQRGADGSLKRSSTKTYAPNFFEQTSVAAFVGDVAGSDTITIRVQSGSAVVYGAATDNKTQDPTLQVARRISTTPAVGQARYLAVVGSAAGSLGSFFKTAVQIHNPTNATISGRFVFHPQGSSGSASDPSMTYTLGPGQTLAFGDLLPAMGQSGLGSVDVISTAGAFPVTVARVYNDAGEAGTTGLSEDLIAADQVLRPGENSILITPPDLASARFNIGVRTLEAGASMNINVLDSSGRSVKTLQKTYSPMFFEQVSASSFIEADVPTNGGIFIFISSGSAILYGATTDNKTQDPSVQFSSRSL